MGLVLELSFPLLFPLPERHVVNESTKLVDLCQQEYAERGEFKTSLADCFKSMLVKHLKGKDEAGWEEVVRRQGGPWTLVSGWLEENQLWRFLRGYEGPSVTHLAKQMSQASLRTLRDGLPPLVRAISRSVPSVPSERQHPAVELTEKPFGCLEVGAWDSISGAMLQFFTNDGNLEYATENDIAGFVAMIIRALIEALKLDAKVFSEVGTFAVRPDLWILTMQGAPIGVVEVKKPDVERKEDGKTILDEPTVLGELYDFMLQLPNFYGVQPVFGILTTFETWRVCWLPSDGTDEEAGRGEGLPSRYGDGQSEFETPKKAGRTKGDSGSPPGMTPSKQHPKVHGVEESSDMEEDEADATEQEDLPKRVMHGSRVFRWDEGDQVALRAVAGALCKMARSTQTAWDDPFDQLETRTVLRFEKGKIGRVYWDHLKHLKGGQWDKYANPPKYLYAIEDLGRGADGRVWLVCSRGGSVCVLKFANNPNKARSDLEHEEKMWHKAYPQFASKVVVETWCGWKALRMPHFAAVALSERRNVLALVENTLRDDYDEKGLVHGDVAWRNVGLFRVGNEQKAVVYDTARVREKTASDEKWVEDAMKKLEQSAG